MWGTLVVAIELALIRYLYAGGSLVWFALALVMPFAFLMILTQKQSQWLSPNPNIEPFEPSSPATPEAVREGIEKDEALIESMGFQRLAYLRVSDFVPGTTSFIALYECKRDQQIAALITAIGHVGPARKGAAALAFQSWCAHRNMLETNNNLIASIIPETNSRQESNSFPEIRCPHRLRDIHQAMLARLDAGRSPELPPTEYPAEFVRESYRDLIAGMEEHGYISSHNRDAVYRLTWKGATLMTLKSLWPVKPIRTMLGRQNAARLLRELRMA
jgi:hypothetical protein